MAAASRSRGSADRVIVRRAREADGPAWIQTREALWPGKPGEHAGEAAAYLRGELAEPLSVLIALWGDVAVGFAELSLRPYAEGCETSPVAYLEGWYVAGHARRRRVGAALVAAAEAWAREQGCTELASDTDLDNEVSARAHEALGFTQVAVVRCFRKSV